MTSRKPRLAITIGDPAGIGPEVALRAIANQSLDAADFTLVGPSRLWREQAERVRCGAVLDHVRMEKTRDPQSGQPIELGHTSARCGAVALAAIVRAVEMCRAGEADALVTAPISKEGLRAAGDPHPGHTELLGDLCGAADTTMMFVGGGMRVALATIHVPLRAVFDLLTPELILRKARHLHEFMKCIGVPKPGIALCGLNPHASEGGLFGDEEARILAPAIEAATREGIRLMGPYPPDTVFYEHLRGNSDAVLALYHDQGLIAVKTVAFDEAVNVTLGLPIIRTSPDHGTAFDIAGKGSARTGSMEAAINLAIRLSREKARS